MAYGRFVPASMTAKILHIVCALALTLKLSAAEPAAEIDARLAALTKAHPVAVSVLVSRDGQVLYEKAVGLADLEARTMSHCSDVSAFIPSLKRFLPSFSVAKINVGESSVIIKNKVIEKRA